MIEGESARLLWGQVAGKAVVFIHRSGYGDDNHHAPRSVVSTPRVSPILSEVEARDL